MFKCILLTLTLLYVVNVEATPKKDNIKLKPVKITSVKPTYAEQQKLNKLSKQAKTKCVMMVDPKTKKRYNVCSK
jgi:hypothetical protein